VAIEIVLGVEHVECEACRLIFAHRREPALPPPALDDPFRERRGRGIADARRDGDATPPPKADKTPPGQATREETPLVEAAA